LKIRALFANLVIVLLLVCCANSSNLTIDSIGFNRGIVTGGQREIDNGHVVNVSQSHGLPGIWLAGHHTTHGAVFRNLGNVDVNDRVCAYDKCYIVFDIIVVATNYWPPDDLSPLVLQTSWYGKVLLILAR